MKKIVSILLVFSILFAFVACSKNKEEENLSSHSVPQINSIKDYKTICVNGTVMTLPVKYSEFFAIMKDYWPTDIDDADDILPPDSYTIILLTDSNDPDDISWDFFIQILNDGTESKKVSECVVAGVDVGSNLSEDEKVPDVQLLGLSVGQKMSIDELINKFGEPDINSPYGDGSDHSSARLSWKIESNSGSSNSNSVDVVIYKGTVKEIDVVALY